MPLTREDAKSALQHVLVNLFQQADDGPIAKAINWQLGDEATIVDVLAMTNDDIDNLTHSDDKDKIIPLILGHRGLLCSLVCYNLFRKAKGDSIGNKWSQVTQGQFDDFRILNDYDPNDIQGGSKSGRANAQPTGTSTFTHDPTYNFKRGIKRDPSLFSQLKDKKQWDAWQRSTTALADAQDVQEVLDPS